jgi:septum formation protein
MTRRIVLASSSPYRKAQLAQLNLPFTVDPADIDEAPHPGETHAQTALRLAQEKARRVAARHPQAIVVGADQVADLNGQAIGKPGSHARALEQLTSMQGQWVNFHSAIAVVDAPSGRCLSRNVGTQVRFRRLEAEALERYLRADQPYDCAGSAKIEGLGICLVDQVRSDDPSALIGLPLIALTDMLISLGWTPPWV